MSVNYGKQWEQKIKEDFLKLGDVSIDRLYDSVSGYKSISNISDFIGYIYPSIYYLEAKSCRGGTFPLSRLTQLEKLQTKIGIPGVRAGALIWFIDHDTVLYVPAKTFVQLQKDGKKSVNVKMATSDTYRVIVIPGQKRRVFIDCDYSILKELKDGD